MRAGTGGLAGGRPHVGCTLQGPGCPGVATWAHVHPQPWASLAPLEPWAHAHSLALPDALEDRQTEEKEPCPLPPLSGGGSAQACVCSLSWGGGDAMDKILLLRGC